MSVKDDVIVRKNESGEVPTEIEEVVEARMRKWLKNADGSLSPEYDLDLGGKQTAPIDNTAHNTYVNLVASVPAGKVLHLKALNITNDEAYKVKVELFSATTLLYEITVPATCSFGLSKDDLIGITVAAAVAFRFRTQVLGGEAYSAGTTVNAGYYLKDA